MCTNWNYQMTLTSAEDLMRCLLPVQQQHTVIRMKFHFPLILNMFSPLKVFFYLWQHILILMNFSQDCNFMCVRVCVSVSVCVFLCSNYKHMSWKHLVKMRTKFSVGETKVYVTLCRSVQTVTWDSEALLCRSTVDSRLSQSYGWKNL